MDVKDWEIIADNLSKAGWSWGYVSAIDCERANNLDCCHRIAPYDNDFTVKWRHGFGRKKRS